MKGGVSWLVLLVVFVADIIAFGLALGAMVNRAEPTLGDNETTEFYCKYPSDKATGMAVAALVFLLFGRVIILVVTKCLCCGRGSMKPGGARVGAILAFSIGWFTFAIAELCLVVGARVNTLRTRDVITYVDASTETPTLMCKHVRKSLFAAAAAFAFLTLLLDELYYLLFMKSSQGSWQQDGPYKTGAPTISMQSY